MPDGAPTLSIRAPDLDGLSYELHARVRFGPLEHEWVQGPYKLAASDMVEVELTLPPEARLHPLADSYVSTLQSFVTLSDVAGALPGKAVAEPVYLLWWDGEGSAPWVLSWQDVALLAPYGTTDESEHLAMEAEAGDVWVTPPIWEYGLADDDQPDAPVDDEARPLLSEKKEGVE